MLTLKPSSPDNQEVSLTGQVKGDEIVFKCTGLPPGPIQFFARRDARGAVNGSVSDPSIVQQLMKQFNVPGVSIAVIKDFRIVAMYATASQASRRARRWRRRQCFRLRQSASQWPRWCR